MKLPYPVLFGLSTLTLWAGDAKSPIIAGTNQGDWQWSVSVGAGVRNIGKVKINSSYRSKNLRLPSFVGSDSLTVPPVGDPDSYGERFYNDGYVRQDASTNVDGLTQYWGYQNASQVRADQLAYSATGYQSIFKEGYHAPRGGPSSRDSLRGFSPHIQADVASPWKVGGMRLGFSGGFDFTSVDQGIAFSNYSGRQSRDDYRLDYQDRYKLDGVIPPAAPYMGSYGGPGPLIGNLPNSRTITPVHLYTDLATLSNLVFSDIDIDVFSFTFGPSLSQPWGPVTLSVQAGVIFNIYNWNAAQTERLDVSTSAGTSTYASWAEKDSGVKFRPGLYTQADLTYDLDERIRIGCYFRLDTASEFRAQAGPTSYKIDPSGFNAGFQIRYALP